MIEFAEQSRPPGSDGWRCAILWLGAAQPCGAVADPGTARCGDGSGRCARVRLRGKMVIDYVVPDYHASRPKACMGGWAQRIINISPGGLAMPCHAAETLRGFAFPNVRDHDLSWIWTESDAFTRFRGTDWMPEPCASCDRKTIDWGGCRLPGSGAARRCGAHRSGLFAVAAPSCDGGGGRGERRAGPGVHLPPDARGGGACRLILVRGSATDLTPFSGLELRSPSAYSID